MTHAGDVIAQLALQPHPEGGWYRETWRGPAMPGSDRETASAILFLLEAGARSHWHRVDADELWLFHAGTPLVLHVAHDDGAAETVRLGADLAGGCSPQALVPAGAWQAAQAGDGWALVGCIVAPAFRFDGFALAAEGWMPGG